MENPNKKYIHQELMYRKASTCFKRDGNRIDLSDKMDLPGEQFVKVVYPITLLREADENELGIFRDIIRHGGTNEVLAYIILTSSEIPEQIEKLHYEEYRKSYKKYLFKRKVKNNRFFRWVHAVVVMPTRAKYYFENSHMREMETLQLVGGLHQKEDEQFAMIDSLSRKLDGLSCKLDGLSCELGGASCELDDLAYKEEILLQKLDSLATVVEYYAKRSKSIATGGTDGVIAIQTEKFIMGVPSQEWRLAMYLSINGYFEYGTEKCFCKILKPGMVVIDVGANLGIFTLHALRGNCEVYSFEPTPETYAILEQNILVNGYEFSNKIHTFNLAVSDRAGTVAFAKSEIACGHNSMFPENKNDEIIEVQTVSLDEQLKDIPKVDIVKIDVEGAERLVLAGMKDIIRKNPDIYIFMEFGINLQRSGVDMETFLDEILEMELHIDVIDDNTGQLEAMERTKLLATPTSNLLLTKKG